MSTVSIQQGSKIIFGPEVGDHRVKLEIVLILIEGGFQLSVDIKPPHHGRYIGQREVESFMKDRIRQVGPVGIVGLHDFLVPMMVHCLVGMTPLIIVVPDDVSTQVIETIKVMIRAIPKK